MIVVARTLPAEFQPFRSERLLQDANALRAHAVESGDIAFGPASETAQRADASGGERPERRATQPGGKGGRVRMRGFRFVGHAVR